MNPERVDGPEANTRLADALAAVRHAVPYLRAEVDSPNRCAVGDVPADGEWLGCADLLSEPAWLGAVIESTGPPLGSDDVVVTTSLFVQNYAYRVVTLAVASLTIAGVLPDSSPATMAVSLRAGRPASLAYLAPKALIVDALELATDDVVRAAVVAALVSDALEGHVAPLVASVRRTVRIGERLLWGNVAASCATAFRTVEGLLGPWVRDVADEFVRRCPPVMDGLGAFYLVERGERHG